MRLYRVLVCLLGVIGITAISSSGVEYTGTQYYSPAKSGGPNFSTGEQTFVCYALRSKIMLDCSFVIVLAKNTHVAAWKPWDGHDYGHIETNRSFGLFYLTLADLAYNYDVAYGQTKGGIVYYNYYPSEVAGYYEIDTHYQFPPDYYCIDPDCLMKTELDVGLTSLERLPDAGPYWEVARGGTSLHSDANWLRGDAKETLIEIAKKYFELSGGRKLSINDMGLKLGGMFDLDGAYFSGGDHKSHRGGVDADINTYGGTIPCRDDRLLKKAIALIIKDGHYAKLKCEDAKVNGVVEKEWRKHIDFN